jgi:osmotically-inducible protein OsmY
MTVFDTPMMARGGRGACPCGCTPWWAVAEEEASYRGKGPARRTDLQITSALEDLLTEDPWLDASGMQVSVQQGIVTLSGTVPSRAAKRRAEELADTIRGVRDVQNTLTIAGHEPIR